jgi:transcriptional regulator with XRE-family HTH domain
MAQNYPCKGCISEAAARRVSWVPPPASRERRIFGSAVRAMRRERQLTQEDVAHKGDLGHKYPGQVERGELNPRLDSMIRLARGLGVQNAEFFHGIAEAFAAAEDGNAAPQRRPHRH